MEKFKEIGIDVRTRNIVTAIERSGNAYRVHTQTPAGPAVVEGELALHAAGRLPDIESLNLSAAGVAVEKGLCLNEYLQSVSNPVVYAAGDAAAQGPPLTPVSSHDGKIGAANILEGNRHRPDYRGVPSVRCRRLLLAFPKLQHVSRHRGCA
jgi:glutathione reductase (NADPH)